MLLQESVHTDYDLGTFSYTPTVNGLYGTFLVARYESRTAGSGLMRTQKEEELNPLQFTVAGSSLCGSCKQQGLFLSMWMFILMLSSCVYV